MNDEPRELRREQKAHAGRNSIQVGQNYTSTTTINISLWISLLVIAIVALGSYVAFNTDGLSDILPHNDQKSDELPTN